METEKTTMTLMVRDIPIDVSRAAKAEAARRGESLRDVVIRGMREYAKTRPAKAKKRSR